MKINRVSYLSIMETKNDFFPPEKNIYPLKFACFHSPISCVFIRKLITAKKTRDLNVNIGTRSKTKEDLF